MPSESGMTKTTPISFKWLKLCHFLLTNSWAAGPHFSGSGLMTISRSSKSAGVKVSYCLKNISFSHSLPSTKRRALITSKRSSCSSIASTESYFRNSSIFFGGSFFRNSIAFSFFRKNPRSVPFTFLMASTIPS